jgi:hypothetical protein
VLRSEINQYHVRHRKYSGSLRSKTFVRISPYKGRLLQKYYGFTCLNPGFGLKTSKQINKQV